MTKRYWMLCIIVIFITSCGQSKLTQKQEATDDTSLQLPFRPNILWLVTEDMGPYLAAFGDSTIETPNLDRLAAQGIIYPHLYSPSGVCAPSRAAIATGLYPSSFGANHMRTRSHTDITELPVYEAIPPPEVRMMSEVLRRNGYYCSNNAKTDYQFKHPVTAWDESSNFAHWRNRESGQPFFSIFNFGVTHESGLFEPYGFRRSEYRHYQAGDSSFITPNWGRKLSEAETPVHVSKDLDFPIPPYLPETDVVKRDMWKLYNNIAEMDREVGAILDQLEADGLLDSTIIFFYGDHGGPLPRQKRLIYDSGLNTPMIIRFPGQWQAGTRDDQLISFIDFAPTVFSLAGIEPPGYLHGQAFLGPYQAKQEREYIHAAADRFDGFTDAIRAVRDQRFKYIRNYRPEQGYYLPIGYREEIPTMQELLKMHEAGTLNDIQEQWFRESKPKEELFDCEKDPYELHNLAENPKYADQLKKMRAEMDRWLKAIGDQPNLPERELIDQLWKGKDQQPVTANPEYEVRDNQVRLSCTTDGASIGYKVITKQHSPKSWEVYTQPFHLPQGATIEVIAHRIGFKPSDMMTIGK